MLRTRLLWFAVGFSASAAANAYYIWKDLLADRASKYSQIKHHFDAMEVRISELESIAGRSSEEAVQDEG
ncbi:hypothetical protein MRB53_035267 [Persea americana]|uniref:Uncharacterized protein n=1 Tax=Persea americana TaxID=3435 RepID=A0ACC2K456_PERAE|nr:hypothetical protein MRB53_035267 [Persea americana]